MDNDFIDDERVEIEKELDVLTAKKNIEEEKIQNMRVNDSTDVNIFDASTDETESDDLKTYIEKLKEQLLLKNKEIEDMDLKYQAITIDHDHKKEEIVVLIKEMEENKQVFLAKESELAQQEKNLSNKQSELVQLQQRLQSKQGELLEKEKVLNERDLISSEKEAVFEREITNQRVVFATELSERKKAFEREISEEKEKHLRELNDIFGELRAKFEESIDQERTIRFKQMDESIKKERTERLASLDSEIKEQINNINHKSELLLKERTQIEEERDNLRSEQNSLELQKRRNERKIQQLKEQEDDLDNVINERIQEKITSYERKIITISQECNSLREQLNNANVEQEKLQTFKAAYGSDPNIFLKRIQDLQTSNTQLLEELASRPARDLSDKFEELKRQNEQLRNEASNIGEQNKTLKKSLDGVNKLEIEKQILTSERDNLKSQVDELSNQCESLRVRIGRLTSVEGRLSDRDERIKEIRSSYIKDMFNPSMQNEMNEVKWLEGIRKNCKDYGIAFPKRILYAFHTALKISDWSTVTVLAGVSGTGKSELPKLYSAFGGLNFINVSVQPNWDSQESMLGFFNSIDNRFDAQPLLRFLVECTEDEIYSDFMSIVLLDEMNLAHVEHYFAEFLSKLENRRGTGKDTVPTIEVKLGAGVEPYHLKLSRTILWTGTMNQDETTKSLSDKVLDRGIVINFPRPKQLSSRKNMAPIDTMIKEINRPMLRKGTWAKWIRREIDFVGEQLDELHKYKRIVEDVNDALESVGRALGHRVWQSIEYYIANYPSVIAAKNEANGELTGELKEAMKTAFEDQIVQKIMPKLRGIETRGKGGEKLRIIEELLEHEGFEKLKDDFEIACEQGYGQFIWSSAKYIEVDEWDEVGVTSAEEVRDYDIEDENKN